MKFATSAAGFAGALIATSLVAIGAPVVSPFPPGSVVSVKVPAASEGASPRPAMELIVVSTEGGDDPVWYRRQDTVLSRVSPAPQTFSHVEALAVSSTGQGDKNRDPWIAISSTGEGHPSIDVYRVSELISGKALPASRSFDAYPGGASFVRWEGDIAIVESMMLLTHLPKLAAKASPNADASDPTQARVPPNLIFDQAQTFAWNPATGEMHARSKAALDPFGYFSRPLRTRQILTPEAAGEVAQTLAALGDVRAIELLKGLLKSQKDADARQEIQSAVAKLEKSRGK